LALFHRGAPVPIGSEPPAIAGGPDPVARDRWASANWCHGRVGRTRPGRYAWCNS